ncbi:MAG: 3-deoxy-manno-octulosonate cytidylyltransferase [Pseudomonadota bacterium]
MSFSVIIPARYASSRLPGKPLRLIAGKPLVQHVFERAAVSGAQRVIIATDDERIARAAEQCGAQVCMTSAQHPSGTDRLAEVVEKLNIPDDHIVVNVQGDEPLIPAALIRQAADALHEHEAASVATLCEQITRGEDLFNPNINKVVMDKYGYALYFSRAPIPWDRAAFAASGDAQPPPRSRYYRHIGLYAYRAGFLKEYVRWPACDLELSEALEQLRVLWNGAKIHVSVASQTPGPGVDTEEDIARVESLLAARAEHIK